MGDPVADRIRELAAMADYPDEIEIGARIMPLYLQQELANWAADAAEAINGSVAYFYKPDLMARWNDLLGAAVER
jgi:hypothetical protein